MVPSIFVSALHCTPDGIDIFLEYKFLWLFSCRKKKKKKGMLSMLSIFLEMKLAFQDGVYMLCSKARKLTRQAHHIMEGTI